jgi:hypothetical protein
MSRFILVPFALIIPIVSVTMTSAAATAVRAQCPVGL